MSGGPRPESGRAAHGGGGRRFEVRVPATSANLGPGFDALGLALGLWDTYTVTERPVLNDRARPTATESGSDRDPAVTVSEGGSDAGTGGCTVDIDGEGAGTVAADEANLVVSAMRAAAAAAGVVLPTFALHCANRIPHGRGLGSSAAAIVGGVLAGRALAGLGRDGAGELALAASLEGHPDNVAAALIGGLTVAWCTDGTAGAVGLTPVPVRVRVFVPPAAMSTHTARALLPTEVPHADAAHAAGRSALLVAALTAATLPDRAAALLAGTDDRLHQSRRGAAMPVTHDLLMRLRSAGVAAVLSGSGPSVLAIRASTTSDSSPSAGVPEAAPAWAGVAVPSAWSVLDLDVVSGASCRQLPGPHRENGTVGEPSTAHGMHTVGS